MFFILFGITFLFILLLIYHFKNKITALEKNVDTMFEILNNVVGDLSRMRVEGGQSAPRPSMIAGVNYSSDNEPVAHFSDVSNGRFVNNDEEESVEDSDDEDGDDEDGESDLSGNDEESEEDSDDEESEEDSDDEENEEEIRKISVILDEKVDEDAIQVEELEDSVTNDAEEVSVPELKEVEDISVEKVDIPMKEESIDLDKMQQYKKMHIQNLKKLVVSKGLATTDDVSKLKKADLLGILEEE